MTMVGQALQGIANPLGFCLPTRVAVDWFPEHEAPLASGIITMAFTFGLAISTGITPIAFSDEDLISWMNVVYFIPAALSFLCAIFILTSDTPPLPPTHSAVVNHDTHMTYMEK